MEQGRCFSAPSSMTTGLGCDISLALPPVTVFVEAPPSSGQDVISIVLFLLPRRKSASAVQVLLPHLLWLPSVPWLLLYWLPPANQICLGSSGLQLYLGKGIPGPVSFTPPGPVGQSAATWLPRPSSSELVSRCSAFTTNFQAFSCASSLHPFSSVRLRLPSGSALVFSPMGSASVLWHPGSTSDACRCGSISLSPQVCLGSSHHRFCRGPCPGSNLGHLYAPSITSYLAPYYIITVVIPLSASSSKFPPVSNFLPSSRATPPLLDFI
ncbi:hypothetical protein DPX16_12787 [Anabarilius grahami]|uniref:Uncharacterized protein n=1 Tax=Anabarilius grahami TaxID=495550 RepID=A0A3N0ZAF0_ANAGA|nr:hypothetical protein DPX16_12787 [Anabarilius grahami]